MRTLTIRFAAAFGALLALAGLACEDGLEPVPFQGVSGTVRFVGEPPDSTEWVRLVVYRELPRGEADFLRFVVFSDSLDLSADSVDYDLPLSPGVYRWLPAVWKRRGAPLGPTGLRVMGWHTERGAGPFASPRPVTVMEDSATTGVDLVADFGRLLSLDEVLDALP